VRSYQAVPPFFVSATAMSRSEASRDSPVLESCVRLLYNGGLRLRQTLRQTGTRHQIEIPVNKTTVSAKPAEVKRQWFVIDAENQTLGNVATECAYRLRGKHKPSYTPHVDTGDYIVVINADKVVVTGNKTKNKMYYRHTGYIGNLKTTNFEKLQQTHPERIIELAVKGMLPKNTLGRQMYRKLRVVVGPRHEHAAQQPIPLEVGKGTGVGRPAATGAA